MQRAKEIDGLYKPMLQIWRQHVLDMKELRKRIDLQEHDGSPLSPGKIPSRTFMNMGNGIDVKAVKDALEVDLFESFEIPEFVTTDPGNSLLLYGPPGTGKTFLLDCLYGEIMHRVPARDQDGEGKRKLFSGSVRVIQISTASLQSKYQGGNELNTRGAFELARRLAAGLTRKSREYAKLAKHKTYRPGLVILFFDEVEVLIGDRSKTGSRSGDKSESKNTTVDLP